MKLKTFVARDLKEALSQVRKELGPEAVILSTQSRRIKEEGAPWGWQPAVEVTAAVDLEGNEALDLLGGGTPPGWPSPGSPLRQIQDDLDDLKGLLRHWLQQNGPPFWLLQHKELAILYRVLTRAGLDEQILLRWLENVQEMVAQGEEQPLTLKEGAFRHLMHTFEVVDPWKTKKEGPRLWTLIGPTGVGKTTTLAKLAVRSSLVKKLRVGLISLDNVRLGAHDQLAAYGRIAGLPLVTANGRGELLEAIKEMADLDLILIDTPGRSPHAKRLQTELRQLFSGMPELEHHLVLSATTKECHLADAISGFSVLPLTSLIITKVDESSDFSGVFNQLCHHKVPISYLTTGQRVPEDLEVATRRKVTELFLKRYQLNSKVTRQREGYEKLSYA
ncbi:MAG: hypothetical protein A2Y80_02390 [Deltaproteobacteria bacterium RBG_13_58_19]|nr:MAG: hypothetical protein A2Y80_02390 [Deltaproteobacteria bacterium RBG_13_58_19]